MFGLKSLKKRKSIHFHGKKFPLKYKKKYIPVDKDRIRKANNELRLKRSKPVSEHKNTLDSCMSLKYM